MRTNIQNVTTSDFPPLLHEIPQPPKILNYRGQLPSSELKLLSIVGSRKYTSYGRQVVDTLVDGLVGYPVGIVSGLALGIDSLAHEAALRNNLYTLAIPGGGLSDDALYPARHKGLAYRILAAGGCLLSEYEPNFRATQWSFPQRNRLVAGISHATLLIEAAEQSGTLITARLAADYNRELLVVPGSIFSRTHVGVHQFLKLGATPVTRAEDILAVLGIEVANRGATTQASLQGSPEAERVLALLSEPRHRDELIRLLALPTDQVAIILMQLELTGHITQLNHIYQARL